MSTYKDTIRLLVLTLVLGAPIAGAQNPDSPAGNSKSTQAAPQASGDDTKASDAATLSSKDRKFVKEAAIGGLYEVQAGQLAMKNASSEDVRLMAQHIVEDHSEANNKLKAIAQSKSVELPTQLDSKHQRKLDSLSKVTGTEFDRKYSSMMVSDHKKDIKAFEKKQPTARTHNSRRSRVKPRQS